MTHDRNGDNYVTPDEYFADMMKNATYGKFFEFIAAGLIFPFKFEVYRNVHIYTEFGSNDYPVRRLRFSQDLSSGHFDAYLPIPAQKITRRRMEVAVEEHDFGIDTPSQLKVVRGCQETLPESHRKAVSEYKKKNPDVQRQAVATYQAAYPEKHRQAVATYEAAHPEKHRNSDMHRVIQSRYRENTIQRIWRSKLLSGLAYDPDIAYGTDSSVVLGSMTYKCQWCNALEWKDETPGMCCSADQHFDRRDIILERRSHLLQRISEIHRAYEALQYPLMFCWGDDGYSINTPQRDPTTKLPLKKTVSAHRITPDQIDNIICAEIPNPDRDPELCEIVKSDMIHGPCQWRNYRAAGLAKCHGPPTQEGPGPRGRELRNIFFNFVSNEELDFTKSIPELADAAPDTSVYPDPEQPQQGTSKIKKAYCEPCWLFANPASKKIQNVWMEGYDDWKHIGDAIERHETSKIHLDSCLINSGGYKKEKSFWRQCRGQGYDGANTMEGTGGVQKLIKDIEPNAVCVHCAAHNLNLVLNDAVREVLKFVKYNVTIFNDRAPPKEFATGHRWYSYATGPCGSLNRNSPFMEDNSCSKRYPKALIKETQTGDD
ncbi:hypothetical protein EVAR_10293_1 [Eumeta japonica]|uniref:EF-hand domain-containing protein n=1 Tax=Eumeta variegata TaxID=151549 RepID=A0A4C1TGE5_EUMVA|nr:hypothetical protein EVAR_10293_1 [Eumeta japonica]